MLINPIKMPSIRSIVEKTWLLFFLFASLSEGFTKPEGKAILITGCDSGFGKLSALKFNENGFKVYATVLSSESAGAHELKSNATQPDKLIVLQMDITKDDQINRVHQMVKQDLSNSRFQLWALVNNAGIGSYSPLEWGTMDRYKSVFDVNVFGMAQVTRVFLPLIKASKGRIVNVLSLFSRISGRLSGIYAMSKHAALAFSEALRQEVHPFGVNVITIEPPMINTGMFSVKSLEANLEKYWNQSSVDVKTSYEDCQSEKMYNHLLFGSPIIVGQNPNPVIQDIFDAIASTYPKPNYRSITKIYRIILFLHLYFPTEFVNWTLETLTNFAELIL